MTRASIRFWFCIAVAVIAAAVADPLVEAVSNAGWFGPGSFTDHSNLDVLPALALGTALVLLHLAERVRRELMRASGAALGGHVWGLLPVAFSVQIVVVYVMETLEQIVVAGHPLGGTVWLGGPIWFSFCVHAGVCVALTIGLARLICACTRTTVRAIRQLRALAVRSVNGNAPVVLRRRQSRAFVSSSPVVCRIGNRAPPYVLV